ncbi:O-antigen ligase family protein [Paenibacillus sp. YPG26]|uniref:O-antigen ligase family protein n=1 Tax=Paenibacillus sp. YPG26 TaxID=2878915 RepID=UPI002040674F|nr:O-antigen ligase family protein [Paenibacillus sp. YPG26]USB32606.1 O-antigen ligase family protein [Paenibacillus sp. YPG26]
MSPRPHTRRAHWPAPRSGAAPASPRPHTRRADWPALRPGAPPASPRPHARRAHWPALRSGASPASPRPRTRRAHWPALRSGAPPASPRPCIRRGHWPALRLGAPPASPRPCTRRAHWPALRPGASPVSSRRSHPLTLLPSRAPRRSSHSAPKRPLRWALAAAVCAWAGLALLFPAPGGGTVLVRTGTSTVSARLLMYRDAMDQIGDSPLWGRGGEVWRSVYRSIQSQPYVGAQVHSGYIDLLLGLGIIGVAVILTWIIGVGLLLLRRRSLWFAPFIVLVLHAGIDFDMSYGLTWLILIWIAVIGTNEGSVQQRKAPPMVFQTTFLPMRRIPTHIHRIQRTVWIYIRRLTDSSQPKRQRLQKRGKLLLRWALRLIPAAAAVVFLMMGVLSVCLMKSEQLSGQALHLITLNRASEAKGLLNRAVQLGPYRFGPRILLSAITDSAYAEGLLREGIKHNPLQSELWLALGRVQVARSDPAAIPSLERAALLDHYNSSLHTSILRQLHTLAHNLDRAGRSHDSDRAARAGLALFRRDQLLANSLSAIRNLRNDRQFSITEAAREQALILERHFFSTATRPNGQIAIRQRHL